MAVPGDSPRSPVITEDPVLVMVEPAITAYVDAAPKFGEVAAKADWLPKDSNVTKLSVTTPSAPRPTRAPEKELGRRCNPRTFQKLRWRKEEPCTGVFIRMLNTAPRNELSSTSARLKTDSLR
jgi:hypothetical protein